MTVLWGFDSAFGPTLAAARQAKAGGITWWAGYGHGPGAYHAWTWGEWEILLEAGLTPGYLWVPTMGLTEDPVQAAHDAVGDAIATGLYGAVMLDTEEGMKASGRLTGWVNAFYATVSSLGRPCPIYTGGGYAPTGAPRFVPLWGTGDTPAGNQAIQYGPATRYGTSVDVDGCAPGFPLASFTPAPKPPSPPKPLPPIVLHPNAYPNIALGNVTGGHMPSVLVALPIGPNGVGWGVLDGATHSDPHSASLSPAVPIAKFVSATPWTNDSVTGASPSDPKISVQNRGGFVYVKASGATPGNTTVAYVVYTD